MKGRVKGGLVEGDQGRWRASWGVRRWLVGRSVVESG